MNIEERFLKYVSYDTQSDEYSNTTPSTLKQLELGKALVKEMLEIGIDDAHLDEYGIVYGTIKGNGGTGDIIGFIAHMDTSPDASGKDIKPQKITNYDGSIKMCIRDRLYSLEAQIHISTSLSNITLGKIISNRSFKQISFSSYCSFINLILLILNLLSK